MARERLVSILFLGLALGPAVALAQSVGVGGNGSVNQCETNTYTVSVPNSSGNPLTDLVISAKLVTLAGFSYVSGTTRIDVNGGAAFCTVNPTLSGSDLIC